MNREIIVGNAVVPWGWSADGRKGWRLPGGQVTEHYPTALRIATKMAKLMA